MQLNFNTKEFEKLLGKVINVVPTHTVNTIYENLKLTVKDYVLALSATDTQIYFEAKMKTDYDGESHLVLPPKILFETIKNIDDSEIKMTVEDDLKKAKFETNTGVFYLSLVSPELYPEFPEVSETTNVDISAAKLKKCLESTAFAAAKEETRMAMSGVLIDMLKTEMRFVATDGHRLVRYALLDINSEIERKIIIPSRAVNILTKILGQGEVKFSFNKAFLKVETEEFIFVVRLIDEAYPNYDSVIPSENENLLEVEKSAIIKAIRRVSPYTNSQTKQVKLSIKQDIMSISAENLDTGSSANEKVLVEYKQTPLDIAFNWLYLTELLNNSDSERVILKMASPARPCIIEPNVQPENAKITMLVMPMRINA